MKKKNGFTLIEILSVIIILGVIMIIAVPAVTKYIFKSKKSVYVSNVYSYVETVRAKYEMKEYGDYLKDDEIMIVPILSVTLEKGNEKESPYGEYDFNRSYVIIVPENNKYNFYATVIDDQGVGLISVDESILEEKTIREEITDDIPTITYFDAIGAIYSINGNDYRKVESRDIYGDDVNNEGVAKAYVFKNITVEYDGDIILHKITLDNKDATTPGTEFLYEVYKVGWYLDTTVKNQIRKITPPYKNGYAFLGYFTEESGAGTQIIGPTGFILVGTESQFTADGIMYANWEECPNGYYSHDSLTCSICPEGFRDGINIENKIGETACIMNVGAGKYASLPGVPITANCSANTFANEHSVKYGSIDSCNSCTSLGSNYQFSAGSTGDTGCYMNVSSGHRKIGPNSNDTEMCDASSYSLAHTSYYGAVDSCNTCPPEQGSNADRTACRTAAVCPTISNYSGTWNNANHSIGVSGGSGGTIQYSTDNENWSTSNPVRREPGSQTTYVRVEGDANHYSVDCGSRTISISKAVIGYPSGNSSLYCGWAMNDRITCPGGTWKTNGHRVVGEDVGCFRSGYGTYINCRVNDPAHYMFPNGSSDASAYFYIVEGRGCSPCSSSRYYDDCGCYG